MMQQLQAASVHDIAVGAALMGAGGGGNPYVGELMAVSAVREFGPVTLLSLDELPDQAIASSFSGIGAPAVSLEKFPNGSEFSLLRKRLEKYTGKKISAVFPIEAGGINSMIPIVAAAQMHLPLIDADGMGRAFPELQMSTLVLAGNRICPMVMANEKGDSVVIDTDDPHTAEKFARAITVQMGATAQSVSDTITGKALKAAGVAGIMTLCRNIGQLIGNAHHYETVADALKQLLALTHGFQMMAAKIVDIRHVTQGGFNFGTIVLEGLNSDQGSQGRIAFQNENIVFIKDDAVLATAPDIIALVDLETLMPITNEEIRYGKRVYVLGIPCDKKWRTAEGISSVGPRYFKYDLDYQPIEKRMQQG